MGEKNPATLDCVDKIKNWSVFQLQTVCKELGLSKTGKKPELMGRLNDKIEAVQTLLEAKETGWPPKQKVPVPTSAPVVHRKAPENHFFGATDQSAEPALLRQLQQATNQQLTAEQLFLQQLQQAASHGQQMTENLLLQQLNQAAGHGHDTDSREVGDKRSGGDLGQVDERKRAKSFLETEDERMDVSDEETDY